MSGASAEALRSAVPVVDLSVLDEALESGKPPKEVLKRFRPADVGRDLSRRNLDQGQRILEQTEERWGAAMLRATHPSLAARLVGAIDSKRAATTLEFLPTDHRVAILGVLAPAERFRVEEALPVAERELVERWKGPSAD